MGRWNSQETVTKWGQRYLGGDSVYVIAKSDGVPPTTIYTALRRLGIQRRKDTQKSRKKKIYDGVPRGSLSLAYHLNHLYGLSLEQYEEQLQKQGGVCLLCGRPPKGGPRASHRLHVDHDHISGRFRGLLCGECNIGLGKFKDDPILLDRAAAYLRLHQEQP